MALLPVLDVLDGVVVHARAGQRAHYAAIKSALVTGCDPVQVLGALLQRAGSRVAYLADLDAIMRGPDCVQWPVLAALGQAHPGLELWLDAGFTSPGQALAALAAAAVRWPGVHALQVRAVLGTETLCVAQNLQAWPECVLSLDFASEGFRGDPAWLAHPDWWPAQMVVMTLARVGMAAGPDLERLRWCRALAPQVALHAAGGVRTQAHLEALGALGVTGALVASALHDGSL